MGKPDRTEREKNQRMASGKYRIWPGVTCITLIGAAAFAFVYMAAYRAGIIPLPEILVELLQMEENRYAVSTQTVEEQVSLTPPVSMEVTRYEPEEQQAEDIFAALHPPEKYHQRFRIRRTTSEGISDISGELYVDGARWLLRYGDTEKIRSEKEAVQVLYLCDGENLYRSIPEPVVTPVGAFTPAFVLGLPTLSWLREEGATAVLQTENKALHLTLTMEDGQVWQGRAALDTGLYMEMELSREGTEVLSMYTEMFDLTPRAMEEADFWTIPTVKMIDEE